MSPSIAFVVMDEDDEMLELEVVKLEEVELEEVELEVVKLEPIETEVFPESILESPHLFVISNSESSLAGSYFWSMISSRSA
jgi:hypothetical protein